MKWRAARERMDVSGKERKGKDERRPGDSQLYYTSLESPN